MKTPDFTISRLLLRPLFCLSLLLSFAQATVRGEERIAAPTVIPHASDEDYILIFNSYSETAPWSNRIISAVSSRLEALSPRTLVLTHNLNTVLIHNEKDLLRMQRQLDSTYVQRPRMLVYVGSISWVFLHEQLEQKWGLLPSVVLANVDFVGPRRYYLEKSAIPTDLRTPFSEIVERYNGSLSVVCYPMYVRETMTMMRLLLPEMEKLCFLSDGTWISAQMRGEVAWAARTDFPDLRVDYLTSTHLSTFDLIDSLYTLGPETGVLYCSWIKQVERSNSIVEDAPYGIISKYTRQPVFVLVDLGIDTDSDVIGGYCSPQDTVIRTAREAVERSFVGEPGNCRVIRTARPIFDYLSMSRLHIDPNLLPDNTLFYWKPVGFFTQYRNLIAGGIGVCVLLLAVIFLLLRQRQQQRKALTYMDRYYTLFDNMPIGYAQLELLRDPQQGQTTDLVIRDVNPAFRAEFAATGEIIGCNLSDRDPLQVENIRRIADTVLDEQRTITTFQYVRRLGKYYKVVFVPAHKEGHVEIFCSDNTVLLRTEERLLRMNRRLKTVLRTAEVIPWRWKLRPGTILFGLTDTAKSRGEETEEEESRFTLSVLYCFDCIHADERERVRQAFRELIEGERTTLCERFRIEGTETLQHFDRVELRAVVYERDEAGRPISLIGSLVGLTEEQSTD